MRDDDAPNPYRDTLLRALGQAMMKRGGELLDGKAAGRRDTAYMLIAAAHSLMPQGAHRDSVWKRAETGTPVTDVYGPYFESEAQSLRHHVFCLARDTYGLSGPYEDRTMYARMDEIHEVAMRDDQGMHEALEALDELRRTRQR